MESWKIYYVLGIVGLLIYLFLFIIGAAYLTIFQPEDYSREDSVTAGTLLISVCTPMLFLPSIIFFIIGWRGRSKFMMYEDVANVLKAYRRIKISELARKFNKPEYEAEKLVMECIERNLVNGYMDRQAQEFFTRDAMHQMPQSKSGWKCSACGAYNDSVILPGRPQNAGIAERSRHQSCNPDHNLRCHIANLQPLRHFNRTKWLHPCMALPIVTDVERPWSLCRNTVNGTVTAAGSMLNFIHC